MTLESLALTKWSEKILYYRIRREREMFILMNNENAQSKEYCVYKVLIIKYSVKIH